MTVNKKGRTVLKRKNSGKRTLRRPDTKKKKVLAELSRIGTSYAAISLSKLIGRRIDVRSAKTFIFPMSQLPRGLTGGEKAVAGIFTQVKRDIEGSMLMLFDRDSAEKLVEMLTRNRKSIDKWLEEEKSALAEVGNICICSYLGALSQMLGLDIEPMPPNFCYDMAGSIIESALVGVSRTANSVVIIETEFIEGRQKINGKFVFIPEADSQKILLNEMGLTN